MGQAQAMPSSIVLDPNLPLPRHALMERLHLVMQGKDPAGTPDISAFLQKRDLGQRPRSFHRDDVSGCEFLYQRDSDGRSVFLTEFCWRDPQTQVSRAAQN